MLQPNLSLTNDTSTPIFTFMKQLLLLMAQYNKTANGELYGILKNGDSELILKQTGSYFDTILGLLNHIVLSDLGWLVGFRTSNRALPSLDTPVLEFEHPGWGKNLYSDFEDLKRHRETIDSLFIEFISTTPEELLDGPIEISRPNRAQVITFPFGKIILHVLNHQTHHRGAISNILDQNGIENDYSNVMQLLM